MRKITLLKMAYDNTINHILPNLTFGLYSKPQAVDIFPTLRCNLKCRHCCFSSFSCFEISSDKWKEIIVNLKKWLGAFWLRISGGEPLLREDLLEIIEFSKSIGVCSLLDTNGSFIDRSVANRILNSGLDIICISLDGFKEETHDYIRGPGVFKDAIAAIEYLRNKIILQITTVIMSYNLDEIFDLVKFAENNRIGINFTGLFLRANNEINNFNFWNGNLWPKDKSKLKFIFDELISRKMNKEKGRVIRNSIGHLRLLKNYYLDPQRHLNYSCQAHRRNLLILPDGRVDFCIWFRNMGNLTQNLPQRIWKSKQAASTREMMEKCPRNCAFIGCYYYETLLEKISRFKSIFLTKMGY